MYRIQFFSTACFHVHPSELSRSEWRADRREFRRATHWMNSFWLFLLLNLPCIRIFLEPKSPFPSCNRPDLSTSLQRRHLYPRYGEDRLRHEVWRATNQMNMPHVSLLLFLKCTSPHLYPGRTSSFKPPGLSTPLGLLYPSQEMMAGSQTCNKLLTSPRLSLLPEMYLAACFIRNLLEILSVSTFPTLLGLLCQRQEMIGVMSDVQQTSLSLFNC